MHSSPLPHSYTEAPSYTYIPALDGLRAVAILLVIFAHFGFERFVPGGFGVTLFFFISGFLISRQLTCEIGSQGTIDFVAFYMRRITRLMPALIVMVFLSGGLFMWVGGRTSIAEVVSALLYAANYYDLYIMYDSNLPGVRHPFIILWSLAIEEHFYIFFPAFFAFFYPRGKQYLRILISLLIIALCWRLTLWHICSGYSCSLRGDYRFYKATDTRFDSILFGVLLTALLAKAGMSAITGLPKSNLLFISGLGLLLLTFLIRSDAFRETYRYSLQGLALIPLIAATLFSPRLRFLRTGLSLPPMLAIGRWSYSLYLYHWVGLMAGDALALTHHARSGMFAAIAVTVVLSLASYYCIEYPALKWRKSSALMQNNLHKKEDASLMGESYPIAGLLCLLGVFLHIALSDPLLNALGLHYSGDEGRFYEKIHPGSIFIFLSFFVLLWSSTNPLRQFFIICQRYTVYAALLMLYIALFLYMLARSGPGGLAFIIDTHMAVPMCAIVLCYTPIPYCRRAVHFFIAVAVLNSLIGIAESLGKLRLFTFDPSWAVLKEHYFRASALRGHPLNNTMFTSIALFVAMGLSYPRWGKALLIIIFMTSLVAFGGRIGLVFSVAGLFILGLAAIRKQFSAGSMTLLQLFLILIAVLLLPLCLMGALYLAIESNIGERIATHIGWDTSAESRLLSFMVFHYMTGAEILFGVPPDRIMSIADRVNATTSLSDIENPWLLMCMNLGVVAFFFWLMATMAFMVRLMKGESLPLQLAVLSYFIIASTSNSFGRKDSTYVIMVAAGICAARSLIPETVQECL